MVAHTGNQDYNTGHNFHQAPHTADQEYNLDLQNYHSMADHRIVAHHIVEWLANLMWLNLWCLMMV